MRRKSLWISGALVMGMAALLYYVLDRDIWTGRCWLPRSFGYDTVTMRIGEELRDYCFHVPLEHGVVDAQIGSDNRIVAYATVPGEQIPNDRNVVDYGPVTEWYVESYRPTFVRRFRPADGKGWLRISPDASLAAVIAGYRTDDVSGATYDVYNTRTDAEVCTYATSDGWFENGCDGLLQSNGEYWDIRQEVDLEVCRLFRERYASDPHCTGFTEHQLTP